MSQADFNNTPEQIADKINNPYLGRPQPIPAFRAFAYLGDAKQLFLLKPSIWLMAGLCATLLKKFLSMLAQWLILRLPFVTDNTFYNFTATFITAKFITILILFFCLAGFAAVAEDIRLGKRFSAYSFFAFKPAYYIYIIVLSALFIFIEYFFTKAFIMVSATLLPDTDSFFFDRLLDDWVTKTFSMLLLSCLALTPALITIAHEKTLKSLFLNISSLFRNPLGFLLFFAVGTLETVFFFTIYWQRSGIAWTQNILFIAQDTVVYILLGLSSYALYRNLFYREA